MKAPSKRWPSLPLATVAIFLALAGGLFAASKFSGTYFLAVASADQTTTAPLRHGDLALVQETLTSEITPGELVGIKLSHTQQQSQGLPAQLTGKVIKITGSGNSREFFVEADGKIASVRSSNTGDSIGKIVELIPYLGFPLLLFSSKSLVYEGFIFSLLGLFFLTICKAKLQRSKNARKDLTLDPNLLGDQFKNYAHAPGNLARVETINRSTDFNFVPEIEKLAARTSAELRMAAEWSLMGELDRPQLFLMLSKAADSIDTLISQHEYHAQYLADTNDASAFVTSAVTSTAPASIRRRKTPFVPLEKVGHKFAIHVAALAALAISMVYLFWRATFTLATLWISIPFLLLEIWSFVDLVLYAYSTWNVDPPEVLIEDDSTLSCTVLIATYNEPVTILLPTVVAASCMEFATETWILDDGNREEVEKMALELGVKYVTRPNHTHAKAGNLNHALRDVTTDLVAVFDADHTPRPEFLSHTIGYFADPSVAVVQTPQEFYNLDSFEHFGALHEESLFYRVIQAGKGRKGAAFWCGTNAVLRVAALKDVGGVSIDSIAEDFQTTIRFHRKGWKSIYHNEVLGHGLAAADISQYTVQRKRWGRGAMQVIKSQDNPLVASGLTLAQRISYFYSLSAWFDSWHTLLMALVPTVVLLTGQFPFRMSPILFVITFLSTFVLQQVVLKLLGRGWNKLWYSLLFDMIRLPSNLVATLTLFAFRKQSRQQKFVVTDKGSMGVARAKMITPWPLIFIALSLSASLIWGLAIVTGYVSAALHPGIAATVTLAWASINLVLVLAAIRRSTSKKYAAERRDGYRLDVTIPVTISHERSYVTNDVSMTGCKVLGVENPPTEEVELTISGVKVKARPRSFDGNKGSFEFLPGQWEAMQKLSMMAFHLQHPAADPSSSTKEA